MAWCSAMLQALCWTSLPDVVPIAARCTRISRPDLIWPGGPSFLLAAIFRINQTYTVVAVGLLGYIPPYPSTNIHPTMSAMDPRVQRILSVIDRDFRDDLSICSLASVVNISPSRLNSIFRMETGLSVKQYLKMYRLLKARELLESTFFSIKETMANVGIKDESHFVRDFEKTFGLSPTRYRKMFHEGILTRAGAAQSG